MRKLHVKVDKTLCEDCSLALRRFIGGLDGVQEVAVERGMIAVGYDDAKLTEEKIAGITRSSIERLGYRLEE